MTIKVTRKILFWYIKVVARNGETVLTSETYSSKSKALKTADMLANETGWELETR